MTQEQGWEVGRHQGKASVLERPMSGPAEKLGCTDPIMLPQLMAVEKDRYTSAKE